MQHEIFCSREFIKSESATAVQRAFRLRFNIQPPTRKSICRWNHQFEQIGCLCKGKSSGRPRVSEEKVRRIQESFERSPRKSTRIASRELGIPQPTVLACVEAPFTVQAIKNYEVSPSFWITVYIDQIVQPLRKVFRRFRPARLYFLGSHRTDVPEIRYGGLYESMTINSTF